MDVKTFVAGLLTVGSGVLHRLRRRSGIVRERGDTADLAARRRNCHGRHGEHGNRDRPGQAGRRRNYRRIDFAATRHEVFRRRLPRPREPCRRIRAPAAVYRGHFGGEDCAGQDQDGLQSESGQRPCRVLQPRFPNGATATPRWAGAPRQGRSSWSSEMRNRTAREGKVFPAAEIIQTIRKISPRDSSSPTCAPPVGR